MSVGAALSRARESAGLSVDDVAAATRIRRTVLLGIERDDFAACGGDFYARGHVRAVATRLGVDPAPLLAEFDADRPGAAPPRASTVFEAETVARPERRGPNWTAAMAAALVLVVAYGVAQAATRSEPPRRGDAARPSVSAPAAAAPSGPPSASTSPSATGGGAAAGVPRDRVTVALAASGTSWVSVTTSSGRPLFQGLLQGGSRRSFTDPSRLRVVIGNAGAVSLTVNGSHLGTSGRPGQVARLAFTPTDPVQG